MLTLDEIESTRQIEYELHLREFDEEALRELLADAAALRALIPPHLSDAEGHGIAEAALAELIARKESGAKPAQPPAEHQPAWAQLFTMFWKPFS